MAERLDMEAIRRAEREAAYDAKWHRLYRLAYLSGVLVFGGLLGAGGFCLAGHLWIMRLCFVVFYAGTALGLWVFIHAE